MQLNKFLAHAGIASRRKSVELIEQGAVRVNNTVIKKPSYMVQAHDVVTVHGKRVIKQEALYILLNKPTGFITTVTDEQGRLTVLDLLKQQIKQRLYPVGRLDRNTTGLLLLTNDGELAHQLAHPRYQIKKVYQITLHKRLTAEDRQRIITGITLPDGPVKIDRISHPLGPDKNIIRLTLHSGKYRIVRRLFEHIGYKIKKLERIQYAFLTKRDLPSGAWRRLTKKEIEGLKKLFKKGETHGPISKN